MLDAVLFDLDGTFIDSTDAIVESFFHTFDVIQRPRPPRDAIIGSIGHLLEDQFDQLTDVDRHECARIYRAHYGAICCAQTTLLPGAHEACRRLRDAGCKLGFATSKRRAYAEPILETLGALEYFDARIGPEDVVRHKPHPEAVLKCCEVLDVRPARTAFIGDTHFDVLAGKAAGARTIAVTTGYETRANLEALEPEAVYDHLDEVTAHLLDGYAVQR